MAEITNTSILDDQETVELFFSCRSLANKDIIGKSDPILYLKKHVHGNSYADVGRTEVIKNDLNPDFSKSFRIEFIFETKQKFKVELIDVDNFNTLEGDYIGSAEFELADIVGSLHNMKILRLIDPKGNETGKCIVRMDKVSEEFQKKIKLQMSVDNIPKTSIFSSHKSFVKMYKLRINEQMLQRIREGDTKYENLPVNEWLLIYKSDVHKGKDITLSAIEIKSSKLCNNNFDIPLKIELWKYKSNGDHKFQGHLFLTVNDLVARIPERNFVSTKTSKAITLHINDFKIEETYEFVDFLRGGLNMTLIVGVDFTASNRDPDDPRSLHHLNQNYLNLYQQAILSVGEILQKYNHTKQIPAYGFGAKIGQPPATSHFFPLNMNYSDPCVTNFSDLFKIYRETCQNVVFSGPTYFAPILKEVVDFTKRRFEIDPNNYSVFLLLTDGIVNDLQASIDQIVAGCYCPLSIIIIGIGEEDFAKMVVLDADDIPLVSSWGETMKRDIVQFVPFTQFKNNPLILREEVLDELPRQVTTFYAMKGIKPRQAETININQFDLVRGNTIGLGNQYQGIFLDDRNPDYPTIE